MSDRERKRDATPPSRLEEPPADRPVHLMPSKPSYGSKIEEIGKKMRDVMRHIHRITRR